VTDIDFDTVHRLATQLRVDSIRSSTAAGSGHPTSSLSAADLMAVLLARHLHYDWDQAEQPANDHLIFSKGHASPLLYSIFRAAGVISADELLKGYRRFGSRLEGHPTPILPWVDVATGSLGQGLPDAVGIALAGARLDRLPYHVWVLCGDSEMSEGSVWEAMDHASHYGLGNLTVIVDINRLGQRGPTELGWNIDAYLRRVEAFGCRALPVDGHDLEAIDRALGASRADEGSRPTVILARTIKGKGVPEVEDKEGWHGKAFPPELAERAIALLGGPSDLTIVGPAPRPGQPAITPAPATPITLPTYPIGAKVATRKAYGDTLRALAARPEVVVLDAEVSNSTYAEDFKAVAPERFFEMFIAEQQMIAAAIGISVRGYVAFASTFAAFLSRAYDFIRMNGISQVNLRLVGTHAGVEIGADGPSQMALEDLASLRAVHGSTLLYPADATATAALVEVMANTPGTVYLRATRGAYPVLYPHGEEFHVGGAKVMRSSLGDRVALVGAGVTLYECLDACDQLASEGIEARVIDLYSVKPVDVATLLDATAATEGRLVVVEDHYPEGGLGAAVLEALAGAGVHQLRLAHLAVRGLPGSGTPAELLDAAGISAPHIVAAARNLIDSIDA
jgi:transketolase